MFQMAVSTEPPRQEPILSTPVRLRGSRPLCNPVVCNPSHEASEIFPSSLILAGICRHSLRVFMSIKFIINVMLLEWSEGMHTGNYLFSTLPLSRAQVIDCVVELCALQSGSDVISPQPCEVPARTCRKVTNIGLSWLLSLPACVSAERSVISQMSRALNENRDENKAKEMKKQYDKPGSPTMNLFKVVMA